MGISGGDASASGVQGGSLSLFKTYGQRGKSKQLRSPFKFLGISDDHDPQEILNGLFGPLPVHGIPLQAEGRPSISSSFRSEMAWQGYLYGRLTYPVARYGTDVDLICNPASFPIAPDR
jgi:hypothetical protein